MANTLEFRNKLDLFFGIGVQIITTMFLIRVVAITSVRMLYPFIPQISAGLGLTVVGFGWLIFIRSAASMTGPLFGFLADRHGRRKIMAAGLLLQGIGLVGMTLSRQWWSVGPIILLGLGISAFLPVQLAFISDLVVYEKRGRVMATIDLSFAITGIAILPITGWLIDAVGWRSPFIILSVFSLMAAAAIWYRFPTIERHAPVHPSWPAMLGVIVKPNVLASVGTGILLLFAGSASMTIWSVWFNADFGLTATALGLVATTIGLAELAGIGLAALFIDRMGKRYGSQLGLLLTALTFVILPLTRSHLFLAILVLIGLNCALEFSVISLLSLYSEQVPEARAIMFSLAGLGMSLGMALGPPITIALWEQANLWAVSAVSSASLLLAFVLVWRVLEEKSGPNLLVIKS